MGSQGYEGVVGKDPTSAYIPGESDRWLKARRSQQGAFVVGGYASTGGGVSGLLLGGYDAGTLQYVGIVGFSNSGRSKARLWSRLRALVVDRSPFVNLRRRPDTTWVQPALVVEISYQEWHDSEFRHPRFLRPREDTRPEACRMPESASL
jgi:ATP-dependent DNA ligase